MATPNLRDSETVFVADGVEDDVADDVATEPLPEVGPDASATTDVRDESSERWSRFRSARISAAVWQRISRSFSSALLMMSSSFCGRSGFKRVGAAGTRLRIASVTTAEVSPRNGAEPVAIS